MIGPAGKDDTPLHQSFTGRPPTPADNALCGPIWLISTFGLATLVSSRRMQSLFNIRTNHGLVPSHAVHTLP